jgi:hypothetical protein
VVHEVFVSYSSADGAAAEVVCQSLEARGLKCWIAPRDQVAGIPYGQQITAAIKQAKVMVMLFSEQVNRSAAVQNEVFVALQGDTTVVPIKIEDVEFNEELRFHIQRLHWLKAFPPPLELHMDALAATIIALIGGRRPPPPPVPPPPVPPPPVPPPPIGDEWDSVPLDRQEWFAFLLAALVPPIGLFFLWRRTYRNKAGKRVLIPLGRKVAASLLAVVIFVIVVPSFLKGVFEGLSSQNGVGTVSDTNIDTASASNIIENNTVIDTTVTVAAPDNSMDTTTSATDTTTTTPLGVYEIWIQNESNQTMNNLFASTSAASDWGDDRLGRSTLLPGNRLKLDLSNAANDCVWDFKEVFSGGKTQIQSNINICEAHVIHVVNPAN